MQPPKPRRIVIAGGTGSIGGSLALLLERRGDDVCVLTRGDSRKQGGISYVNWDAESLGGWAQALVGADVVVNLCGRTVDCIKTPDHCDEILRSRVLTTTILGQAVHQCITQPKVWVQMSTAHIYGDPHTTVCDEHAPHGYGLAPFVGASWERACVENVPHSIRTVILRTSFVMSKSGGALQRLKMLARVGLGGTIGSGSQGMSWIHEDDMNALFLRAFDDVTMTGTYNETSPNPVSNKEFMLALRRSVSMRVGLPASASMVRFGAHFLLRTDPDLALYGRYVVSKRLTDENFVFTYPLIDTALKSLA